VKFAEKFLGQRKMWFELACAHYIESVPSSPATARKCGGCRGIRFSMRVEPTCMFMLGGNPVKDVDPRGLRAAEPQGSIMLRNLDAERRMKESGQVDSTILQPGDIFLPTFLKLRRPGSLVSGELRLLGSECGALGNPPKFKSGDALKAHNNEVKAVVRKLKLNR